MRGKIKELLENTSMIYKHTETGEYLLLIKEKESQFNQYKVVDKDGKPILKTFGKTRKLNEIIRIIKGFDKLQPWTK